jgi:recombination protein RecA
MAKEKKAATPTTDDYADRVFAEITKDYGANVIIDGTAALEEKFVVIPWSPCLDIISSGGIQEGSWVGITGNEKTGKTTAALSFAVNAQKAEYGSRPIYYFKVEGRLSQVHLAGIKGLNHKTFHVIQSTPADEEKGIPAKILTAQDFLRIAEKIIKTVPRSVLIIDSISALCDEKEMEGGLGTETRGGGAKVFSQFVHLVNQAVPINRIIVIGITHLISNTSGMGANLVERSARAWRYQYDYAFRTQMVEQWKAGETPIGLKIKWLCKTSKLGIPGMSIEGYLRFGTGLDRTFEMLNMAVAANLITKKGSWLLLSFLEGVVDKVPNVQGDEKAYKLLQDNPEWAALLEKKVLTMMGVAA